MKSLVFALLFVLLIGSAGAEDKTPQTILNLLDYVAVEYPGFVRDGKVLNADEYAEQLEFSGQIEVLIRALPPNPQRDRLATRASQLQRLIAEKRDATQVVEVAREIQRGLIAAYDVVVTPRRAPDPSSASALYDANCASCHGVRGDGVGPQAAALNPRPSNFTDRERQAARSVYGLFNTISLGVSGTSMPSFAHLSADERWALAFYVTGFSATDEERTQGRVAWERGKGKAQFGGLGPLVMMTPAEARSQSVAEILAFLRTEPSLVEAGARSPLAFSMVTMERSFAAWEAGRADEAYKLAVTAYLEGFELAEANVDSVDRSLRSRTEEAMMAYRNALQARASPARVQAQFDAAMALLREAQTRTEGSTASATGSFISSVVIILREGLEAILVLAAMAAFLVRTGRRQGLPWLHGGWIAALALGALTWIISSKLISISGAQREVTEGVTALLSSAVLLYVGFWLHSKSSSAKWSDFIKTQMRGAAGGGTLAGVGLVAFLAVYREVFETVLFYQALWMQSEGAARTAVMTGFLAGFAGLVVLAWLIIRVSVRLPLGLFFGLSSALLAVMAVVFAGQGIAALQAAGKLPVYPVGLPSVPLLGIYPNLQSLGLQVSLVALIVLGYLYMRAQTRHV